MRYSSTSRLVLQYQIAYTKKDILMDDSIGTILSVARS